MKIKSKNLYPLLPIVIIVNMTALTMWQALAFLGCGAGDFKEDNSQPAIGRIRDQTLNVGDVTWRMVSITDANVDDTHTISVSADDTTVAAFSVSGARVYIAGLAAGTTTVTLSATDNSGQDNGAAVPVTFEVMVKESPPLLSFIDKGDCTVGMTVKPGEGCSYHSDDPTSRLTSHFFVDQDGNVCRERVPIQVIEGITIPNSQSCIDTKGDFAVRFGRNRAVAKNFSEEFFGVDPVYLAAHKNPDGSWTIGLTSSASYFTKWRDF